MEPDTLPHHGGDLMVMMGFTVPGAIESIRNGTKVTTIRHANPKREEQIRKSRRYDNYWKPRTKECQLIGRYPLLSMTSFRFDEDFLEKCDSKILYGDRMHKIARKDGFEDAFEMYWWFLETYQKQPLHELPFTIHEWEPRRIA